MGELLSKDTDDLLNFEEVCTQYLNDFYKHSLGENSTCARANHIKSTVNYVKHFNRQGIQSGKDAEDFINKIFLKIEKNLKDKLIK